jgi:hypothetical protein
MCGAVPPPDTPRARDEQRPSTQHKVAGLAKLGTGLAVVAGEVVEGAHHPALADALVIADVAIPAAVLLLVFAVITRGSQQTCDRVFRLLRWLANRPEPPAPGPVRPPSGSAPPASTSHASP